MAIIGTLGDIVFEVSQNKVNTITSVEWNSSANYASHDRHLKDPLLEFTGNDNDTFSLSMKFSVFLGVDPMKEITKLLTAERNAEVMRLVIGPKAYGKNKWVITKSSHTLDRFDNRGNLLVASATVSLTAYASR